MLVAVFCRLSKKAASCLFIVREYIGMRNFDNGYFLS